MDSQTSYVASNAEKENGLGGGHDEWADSGGKRGDDQAILLS